MRRNDIRPERPGGCEASGYGPDFHTDKDRGPEPRTPAFEGQSCEQCGRPLTGRKERQRAEIVTAVARLKRELSVQ